MSEDLKHELEEWQALGQEAWNLFQYDEQGIDCVSAQLDPSPGELTDLCQMAAVASSKAAVAGAIVETLRICRGADRQVSLTTE